MKSLAMLQRLYVRFMVVGLDLGFSGEERSLGSHQCSTFQGSSEGPGAIVQKHDWPGRFSSPFNFGRK